MANTLPTGRFHVNAELLDKLLTPENYKRAGLPSVHTFPDAILQSGYMDISDNGGGVVRIALCNGDGTPYTANDGKDAVLLAPGGPLIENKDNLKRRVPLERGYHEVGYPAGQTQLVYLDGKGGVQFYDAGAQPKPQWGATPEFAGAHNTEQENALYQALNGVITKLDKLPADVAKANGDDVVHNVQESAPVKKVTKVLRDTKASYALGDVLRYGRLYVQTQGGETPEQAMRHETDGVKDAIFYRLTKDGEAQSCRAGEGQWAPVDGATLAALAAHGEFVVVDPVKAKATHNVDLEFKGGLSMDSARKAGADLAAQAVKNPVFVAGAAIVGIGVIGEIIGKIRSKAESAGKDISQKAKSVWETIGKIFSVGGAAIILADVIGRGFAAAGHKEYEEFVDKKLGDPIKNLMEKHGPPLDPSLLAQGIGRS